MAAVYEYLNLAIPPGRHRRVSSRPRICLDTERRSSAQLPPPVMLTPLSASRRFAPADRIGLGPIFGAAEATSELIELRHPLVHDAVPNSIACPSRPWCARDRFQHVRQVDVSQDGRRQCRSRPDDSTPVWRESIGRRYSMCAAASGGSDDLLAGKSYYIVEVEALLELVRASDDACAAFVLARRAVSRHQRRRAHRRGPGGPAGAARHGFRRDEASRRTGRDA